MKSLYSGDKAKNLLNQIYSQDSTISKGALNELKKKIDEGGVATQEAVNSYQNHITMRDHYSIKMEEMAIDGQWSSITSILGVVNQEAVAQGIIAAPLSESQLRDIAINTLRADPAVTNIIYSIIDGMSDAKKREINTTYNG